MFQSLPTPPTQKPFTSDIMYRTLVLLSSVNLIIPGSKDKCPPTTPRDLKGYIISGEYGVRAGLPPRPASKAWPRTTLVYFL